MRFAVLALFVVFVSVGARNFNYYKSYKDAKVKPENYGNKLLRDHPIMEYLSPDQQTMMKRRKGPDLPEMTFDASWSGKDKKQRRLLTQDPISLRGAQVIDTNSNGIFKVPDWTLLAPPEFGSSYWWVYVLMVFTIVLTAVATAAMMLALCCLALHPSRKELDVDLDEHTEKGGVDFDCMPNKDLDA